MVSEVIIAAHDQVTVGMYCTTCVTAVLMVHDKLLHFDDHQESVQRPQ